VEWEHQCVASDDDFPLEVESSEEDLEEVDQEYERVMVWLHSVARGSALVGRLS